ncbi:hypothetical protein CDEST_15471 [Colletotrichum destructivum]|uniref:Uncharacterized protein n=1 Tax=Colletotrichum destructivum TaxID=34406 RepID=A0AAX4J4F2_9PEZI|nr:hypothetical protein CDEST_15471 [Colletotrichum destructivum]
MASVKYVRRRNITTAPPRRVSTRMASRQTTATKTLNNPEGPAQSKPRIGNKTAPKADTKIRNLAIAGVPRSQDYLDSDELTGWKYYSSTKSVDILTRRPADGSKRLVSERLIQQREVIATAVRGRYVAFRAHESSGRRPDS